MGTFQDYFSYEFCNGKKHRLFGCCAQAGSSFSPNDYPFFPLTGIYFGLRRFPISASSSSVEADEKYISAGTVKVGRLFHSGALIVELMFHLFGRPVRIRLLRPTDHLREVELHRRSHG